MKVFKESAPQLQFNKTQTTVVLPGHQDLSRQTVCQRFLRWLRNDWWIAKNFGFPYPEGWAVYNPKKGAVMETGMNKTHAKLICRKLNGLL